MDRGMNKRMTATVVSAFRPSAIAEPNKKAEGKPLDLEMLMDVPLAK